MWELTIPQLRALKTIALRPECAMGELARSLRISLGAATGVADRLIQHGLVEREADAQDRRVVRLRLTDAGRRAHDAGMREARRRVAQALSKLAPEKREQVAAALILLRQALEVEEEHRDSRNGARRSQGCSNARPHRKPTRNGRRSHAGPTS